MINADDVKYKDVAHILEQPRSGCINCQAKTFGAGNEISAFPSVIGDCACRGVGYTIRPLINNANWGGVEGSCTRNQTLDNQTLQVILEKK